MKKIVSVDFEAVCDAGQNIFELKKSCYKKDNPVKKLLKLFCESSHLDSLVIEALKFSADDFLLNGDLPSFPLKKLSLPFSCIPAKALFVILDKYKESLKEVHLKFFDTKYWSAQDIIALSENYSSFLKTPFEEMSFYELTLIDLKKKGFGANFIPEQSQINPFQANSGSLSSAINHTDLFIDPSSRELFCCSPMDMANALYYSAVDSLHNPLCGFTTPSSDHPSEISELIVAHCFKTQLGVYIERFRVGEQNDPFIISEIGGGEGILLEKICQNLKMLIDSVVSDAVKRDSILEHIQILLLDHSAALLEKQRGVVERSGLKVCNSSPIDVGKAIKAVPEWMIPIRNSVSYMYSCEFLDDISGGEVVRFDSDSRKWYAFEVVFLVNHDDCNPKKRSSYVKSQDVFSVNHAYENVYCLTQDQAVEHIQYIKEKKLQSKFFSRDGYFLMSVRHPCEEPFGSMCHSDEISQEIYTYINRFHGLEKNLSYFCRDNATMTHMDYLTNAPITKTDFYPSRTSANFDIMWDAILRHLTGDTEGVSFQQPTVGVSVPGLVDQEKGALRKWGVQPCSLASFEESFATPLYLELNVKRNQIGDYLDNRYGQMMLTSSVNPSFVRPVWEYSFSPASPWRFSILFSLLYRNYSGPSRGTITEIK